MIDISIYYPVRLAGSVTFLRRALNSASTSSRVRLPLPPEVLGDKSCSGPAQSAGLLRIFQKLPDRSRERLRFGGNQVAADAVLHGVTRSPLVHRNDGQARV